ncbi:OmpA family protein [Bdellovibrio sp. HCB337]|uniref:OmpA family protein n=1 Tax=Bdellovibrio sp. HCB337 TaxID=3394358 RepID=UPI0039A475F8
MKLKLLFALSGLLLPASALANICGTDYQNFNPTTNGLDFVTVQSSETLKPCIANMGVFFNYAADSLTYSQSLNATYENGQKSRDRILGADLSLGFGLAERWDAGINVPFIVSQEVTDDYYVSSYGEKGATEVKLNTKYRFFGGDDGGFAAVLSMNKNLIENNPFTGTGAGPTWNLEFAADTTLASNWAVAVNAGYRWRDKGEPIPNVPFVPMGNQWIYSAAASYLVASLDTKIIAEVYGSRAAEPVDQDTDRSLNALEGLVGLKYDATTNLALHAGGASQLDTSMGGPEWRVYMGLNWAIETGCAKPAAPEPVPATPPPATTAEAKAPVEEAFNVDVELLFGWNSDKVDEESFSKLEPFFQDLFKRDFDRLVVEGHTDSVGVEVYNLDLSQRRAKNVRDYLVAKYKLPENKIESIGYGQTQPVADNGNFQGRRKNRRVALKVYRSVASSPK